MQSTHIISKKLFCYIVHGRINCSNSYIMSITGTTVLQKSFIGASPLLVMLLVYICIFVFVFVFMCRYTAHVPISTACIVIPHWRSCDANECLGTVERRLQSQREWRRQRLLGESADDREGRLRHEPLCLQSQ